MMGGGGREGGRENWEKMLKAAIFYQSATCVPFSPNLSLFFGFIAFGAMAASLTVLILLGLAQRMRVQIPCLPSLIRQKSEDFKATS